MNKINNAHCPPEQAPHKPRFGLVAWLLQHRLPLALRAVSPPDRTDRLLALQRLLTAAFQDCGARMSGRDRRLYQQLVHSESLDTIRHLRFECFDLMCRLLGEGVARARQPQIDAWLTSRH